MKYLSRQTNKSDDAKSFSAEIPAIQTKSQREKSLLCKLISFDMVSNGSESIIAMGFLTP